MFDKLKAVWDRMVERFRFDSALMATLEEQSVKIYALEQNVERLTATVRSNTAELKQLRAAFRGKYAPPEPEEPEADEK